MQRRRVQLSVKSQKEMRVRMLRTFSRSAHATILPWRRGIRVISCIVGCEQSRNCVDISEMTCCFPCTPSRVLLDKSGKMLIWLWFFLRGTVRSAIAMPLRMDGQKVRAMKQAGGVTCGQLTEIF